MPSTALGVACRRIMVKPSLRYKLHFLSSMTQEAALLIGQHADGGLCSAERRFESFIRGQHAAHSRLSQGMCLPGSQC